MGRTVQTLAAAGATSTAGITSADALTLIRAHAGYEYIKTAKLTASEVAAIEITGLDSSLYSGFRLIGNRLGYGSSASAVTWTVRVLTGSAGSTDSGANYFYEAFKFASGFTSAYNSGATSWTHVMGYGGPPATADFTMDYNIVGGSNNDANMWLNVHVAKSGGYWGGAGVMTGTHISNGATPTGIRIESSMNFRSMNSADSYVTVLGLRTKT